MTAGESPLDGISLLLRQRRPVAALRALQALPPALARTPAAALLEGRVLARLGRVDAACQRLQPLLEAAQPWAGEARAALADVLFLAHRLPALRELLERCRTWATTPRGQLFAARLQLDDDPEQALASLLALAQSEPQQPWGRLAGFDAVKLLDRLGRYREAFALATRLHAAEPPFPLAAYLTGVQQQQRLLDKGRSWCEPRAALVQGTAFVVGLPRSGTTLLEQMLDAHPAVAGIGEHEGVGELAEGVVAAGAWPYRLKHLPAASAQALQQHYLQSARQRVERTAAAWTLDKSLITWRWLPALAAVLPGAVMLRVQRQPRDTAISAFLSELDPAAFGWTASLASALQVIEAERALVAQALQVLALPHENIVYEELVADPAATLQRCTERLGLAMDARVLRPEDNPRTAVTLSHLQVKRAVNASAVGRWQHYEFAFGTEP